MKLKQYVRYEMNMQSKWAGVCTGCMGLSFFLRVLYFFGLVNLSDVGAGVIFLDLILPLLFCAGYLIVFSVMKLNAPGIYAIAGSIFCLLLMLWNFSGGDVLRSILSVVLYILAAVVLLATAGGYLPGKLPSTLIFSVLLIARLLMYSLNQTGLGEYILEFSAVCILVSMTVLTRCFKPRTRTKESE